jgi:hypothetical protein
MEDGSRKMEVGVEAGGFTLVDSSFFSSTVPNSGVPFLFIVHLFIKL